MSLNKVPVWCSFFRRLGFGFAPCRPEFWAISRAANPVAQQGVYQIPSGLCTLKISKTVLSWRTPNQCGRTVALVHHAWWLTCCVTMDRPLHGKAALCVEQEFFLTDLLWGKAEWTELQTRLIKSGQYIPKFKLEMSWTWCKMQK